MNTEPSMAASQVDPLVGQSSCDRRHKQTALLREQLPQYGTARAVIFDDREYAQNECRVSDRGGIGPFPDGAAVLLCNHNDDLLVVFGGLQSSL